VDAKPPPEEIRMKTLSLLLLTFLLTLNAAAPETRPRPAASTLRAVSTLPVLHDGRVMPLETFARLHLLQFSGRKTIGDQSATEWMLNLLFDPERTRGQPVFLINNHAVLEAVNLPIIERVEGQKPSGRRFSLDHLRPGLPELDRLARAAARLEPEERDEVDKEILRLFSNLIVYRQLGMVFAHIRPNPSLHVEDPGLRARLGLRDDETDLAYYRIRPLAQELNGQVLEAIQARSEPELSDAEKHFLTHINEFWLFSQQLPFRVLPTAPHGEPEWLPPFDALYQDDRDTQLIRAAHRLSEFGLAWRAADWEEALAAFRDVENFVQDRMKHVRDVRLTLSESRYHRANFYGKAKTLYIIAFLLATMGLISGNATFRRAAWVPVTIAGVWHVIGLCWRVYLTARPPVTNLYGTFLFVSLICLVLALLVEWKQKNSLGLFAGSFISMTFLFLAERFGAEGDTLQKVVAVLASNFWLSTHVIAVTIGYAGVWIAGVFGHIWLLLNLCNRSEEKQKSVMNALNGVLGFGLTFAFLGTMLGGIWADQSWGRFWGWDPKENGALLIVLWTAVIYHARVGGMIREKGAAAGAAFGCVMVMLAWLGVNLLGVGLHSYGFTSAMRTGFYIYVFAEIIFIALALGFLAIRDAAPQGEREAKVLPEGALPLPLQLLSGLFTIAGVLGLVAVVGIAVFEGRNADFGDAIRRLGFSPFLLESYVLLVFGTALIAGIGLFQKALWGWAATSFLIFLNLFGKALGLLSVWVEWYRLPNEVFMNLHGNPMLYIGQKLVYLVLWLALAVYILRKPTRDLFGVTDDKFTKLLLWTAGAGLIIPILLNMARMVTA